MLVVCYYLIGASVLMLAMLLAFKVLEVLEENGFVNIDKYFSDDEDEELGD